ncbi:class I SAM-dependent methyltransferase [Lacihabitans sp. LS3-19]|uniref:SAM-dependent methyltransferase n=1 Tax=Lacihabitans sp. LS3-19 TaxID=2487335 RepID=UPI0020CCE798|nr:class I SAM-dependent methyltransferase [Lacihabitans sp. LS3-19]MCP9769372.1 class I SAM-dependent methyltransferase [Lacihabitans sp. LS3-19]
MAEWFAEWFDTPFYHILYKSRGENEAQKFIDNLAEKLNFSSDWQYCDMACGKGRHAIYLNSKNFEVTGLDLSPNNIWHAQCAENEKLQFHEHDIRDTFRPEYFDVMLNLFTSFGYFENQEENQKAVKAMSNSLKSGGILVLDYMNSRKAIEGFNSHYEKTVDGIQFNINKRIEFGFIFKNISFENEGKNHKYEERVKLLFLEDFKHFFEASNLTLIDVYGDYELNPYQDLASDRMIMVCKKN